VTAGFFAPLPPARTGVADYAAALSGALRQYGTVRIGEAGDVNLYHLGNNQLHRGIYARAIAEPGVAVLHDAVLQHFFLGSLDARQYVEEFVFNYGEWSRGVAEDLWRRRASSGSGARYFAYPMLRRIAERSRAVVVHNPGAAALVRAHAPSARVIEIPLLWRQPAYPTAAEALRFRQSCGIPLRAFVFGVIGYLRESKRLASVLKALERTRDPWLLIAGDFVSSDLERAIVPLLRRGRIVRLPYLPGRRFWLAALACDACINLRDPAAGETSDVAVQMMGAGKPVLLTASEDNKPFPADACVRIEAGLRERESLYEHMVLLTSFAGLGRKIGANAAAHIAAHHALPRIARTYWDTLCASLR
jgi:glycosyltransferase involved in cell wall biosynthesis